MDYQRIFAMGSTWNPFQRNNGIHFNQKFMQIFFRSRLCCCCCCCFLICQTLSQIMKQHGNGNAYDIIKNHVLCKFFFFIEVMLFSLSFATFFFISFLNCSFKLFRERTWCSSLHHAHSIISISIHLLTKKKNAQIQRESYLLLTCYTYSIEFKSNLNTPRKKCVQVFLWVFWCIFFSFASRQKRDNSKNSNNTKRKRKRGSTSHNEYLYCNINNNAVSTTVLIRTDSIHDANRCGFLLLLLLIH